MDYRTDHDLHSFPIHHVYITLQSFGSVMEKGEGNQLRGAGNGLDEELVSESEKGKQLGKREQITPWKTHHSFSCLNLEHISQGRVLPQDGTDLPCPNET